LSGWFNIVYIPPQLSVALWNWSLNIKILDEKFDMQNKGGIENVC
jgi:hypothetical protein